VLGQRLPECRTRDILLPGAWGLDEAREALSGFAGLSDTGVERLLRVYGGRAAGVAALATESNALAGFIDAAATLPEAEVAFVIREELPKTLTDVVFRRMMIGLDADQGRPHYARIAKLAADEFGWDEATRTEEMRSLVDYADSLRVG
jgi:glycerol-3-phosphate dehydrogenase